MKRLVVGLLLGACIVSMTGCAKIVKIGTEAELTGEVSFEDSLDVSSFWDSQAVPEVKENAVELSDLLNESNGDLDSKASEYGRTSNDTNDTVNFAVHGEGTVETVFTEKKAGYLEIKLDGYDGDVKVRLQIGSVIKKTSIRDYLSFINVNDYSDQIEYAQLSKSINAYVQENVIDPANVTDSQGKHIEFYGCFTAEGDEEVLITPVEITIS